MSRRPLCHLLYMNAPGLGGAGFRILAVNFPGHPEEQKAVADWLTGLQLPDRQQQGWAVHAFAVDRCLCFALAFVGRPSFACDDHGRTGFLAHAFLVLLEEGKPAGDFGLALLDKAQSFLSSGALTLDTYLKGVKVATNLDVPDLQLNNFRGLDRRFLETFYAAACTGGNGEVFLPGCTSEDELPEHLLAASLALPPRLRLDLPWRVGLKPGRGGFVAHVAQAGSSAPPVVNEGTEYLKAVQAQLGRDQADRVAKFAANAWGVRQWSGLERALIRAEPEKKVRNVGNSVQSEKSGTLAKKDYSAAVDKPVPAPRVKSLESYDAEYQALEKDLRDYLDQRLAQAEARLTPVQSPSEEREEPLSFLRRLQAWRPEIYFLILLLLVTAEHLSLRKAITFDSSRWTPSASLAREKPTQTPQETIQSADPLIAWQEFVESPTAVQWFRDLAEGHELEPSQITDRMRERSKSWADRLVRGERLQEQELTASRIGFFEYSHALWAKENGIDNPAENVVTLNPSEVAPHLQDFISSLGLTGKLGAGPSVTDPKVQAAVALAWIYQHTIP